MIKKVKNQWFSIISKVFLSRIMSEMRAKLFLVSQVGFVDVGVFQEFGGVAR